MRLHSTIAWLVLTCRAWLITALINGSRTNLCAGVQAVHNGSINTKDALVGARLRVGTGFFDDLYLRKDSATGALVGFEKDLLDDLSKRAGFTYEFFVTDWASVTSWSTFLLDLIQTYDLVTYSYWVSTPGRMMIGGFTPYGFNEASLILVAYQNNENQSTLASLMQFSEPFSHSVWAAVCVLVFVTGLIHWLVEGRDQEADQGTKHSQHHVSSAVQAVANSFLQLTTGGGLYPKSWPGKILLLSWSWCVLLLVAAYTANLASFLVAKIEAPAEFDNLNQAVRRGKTICVGKGTVHADWFRETYPDHKFVVEKPSALDLLTALHNHECDATLFQVFEFHEYRQNPKVKRRCELRIVGQPINYYSAGWMTLNDYAGMCTVLVRDVLSYHFAMMNSDGTVEKLRKAALEKQAAECPEPEEEEPEENQKLGLDAVTGILLMHILGCFVAVACFLIMKFKKRDRTRSTAGRQRWGINAGGINADESGIVGV